MKKYLLAIVLPVFVTLGISGNAYAAGAATCGSGYSSASSSRLVNANATQDTGPAVQKLFVKKVDAGWRWCLITDRTGAAEGTASYTSAALKHLLAKNYSSVDANSYAHYAGPVYLTTKKRQVAASSEMRFNGKLYVMNISLSN